MSVRLWGGVRSRAPAAVPQLFGDVVEADEGHRIVLPTEDGPADECAHSGPVLMCEVDGRGGGPAEVLDRVGTRRRVVVQGEEFGHRVSAQ